MSFAQTGVRPPSLAQPETPAQASASTAAAAKPATLMSLPPETVVATVDGEQILARQLQVIGQYNTSLQSAAVTDLPLIVQQYVLMKRMASMAEKVGLDQKSPLKERLAYIRDVELSQAEGTEIQRRTNITSAQARKYYDDNPDQFIQAYIKIIYVSFSPNAATAQADAAKRPLTEAQAKAKADKLYAELKAGADFVKLVKEHSEDPGSRSKDGDFGPIRKSDNLPPAIITAAFSLKPGEVAQPVRHTNGFYIMRLERLEKQDFLSLEGKLIEMLSDLEVQAQIQELTKGIKITMEPLPAATPSSPQTPAPAPSK
jgi:parvulin-like peptidyl-prolyl isomerase